MMKLLLTGASGVLGSEIVRQIRRSLPAAEIYCLLRANSAEALAEKRDAILSYSGPEISQPDGARLHFVPGDIEQPRLGLSEAQYQELARSVTHLIHAAASVRLNQSRTIAFKGIYEATKTVAEFASTASRYGSLNHFSYVSTVGVGGASVQSVPEAPVPHASGFRNFYEEAKHAAEQELFARAAHDFPLVIHRPSMIVGRYEDGIVRTAQIFYYLSRFCSGQDTFGILPNFGETRLDIIPVDTTAKIIVWALNRNLPSGSILHACSGRAAALPLETLGDLFDQAMGAAKTKILLRSNLVFELIYRALLKSPRASRLAFVPFILPYLDSRQGFENSRTRSLVAPDGIQIPAPSTYALRLLQNFVSHSAKRSPQNEY